MRRIVHLLLLALLSFSLAGLLAGEARPSDLGPGFKIDAAVLAHVNAGASQLPVRLFGSHRTTANTDLGLVPRRQLGPIGAESTPVASSDRASNRFGAASAEPTDDVLAFDGTSAYVQTADSANLRPEAANAFTVAFWVKLGSLTNNVLPRFWEKGGDYMALMGDPTNGQFRHLAIEVQNASGSGNTNGGASEFWGSTALQTGVWYHVIGVFDGSLPSAQGRIYVNGSPETMRAIFPWTGTLRTTAGKDLYLARRHQDLARNLQGQLDSFVFYTRALSSSEIAQLNADLPPPGAAVSYGFNEGAGTTATNGSGSGNPGTLDGAVYTPLVGRAATVAPTSSVG